jgi:hypothetical protein
MGPRIRVPGIECQETSDRGPLLAEPEHAAGAQEEVFSQSGLSGDACGWRMCVALRCSLVRNPDYSAELDARDFESVSGATYDRVLVVWRSIADASGALSATQLLPSWQNYGLKLQACPDYKLELGVNRPNFGRVCMDKSGLKAAAISSFREGSNRHG